MYMNPANKNYLEAQTLIGVDYINGYKVPTNYTIAIEWFQKAACENYAPAQNMLGTMFRDGHGIEQDYEQALKWFEKAAIQNYDEGQTNLALMYVSGVNNLVDYVKAFEWMQKAADQGHTVAQYFMGEMCKDKDFVNHPSSIKAFEWYKKAADKGLSDAQACIAEMYKQGEGVSQDDTKALEWYRKAAEQGHTQAQQWLAKLANQYEPTAQDDIEECVNDVKSLNSNKKLPIPFREFFDSYFRDESERLPQNPGGGVFFFESMSMDEISKFSDKSSDIRQKTNYEVDILNADFMIDTSLVVKNYGAGLFLHVYEHSYRFHLKNYAQDWKIVNEIESIYYDKTDNLLLINGYKVSLISKSSYMYGERLAECINAYLNQSNEQDSEQEIVSNSELVTNALDNIDSRLAEIEEKLESLQHSSAA